MGVDLVRDALRREELHQRHTRRTLAALALVLVAGSAIIAAILVPAAWVACMTGAGLAGLGAVVALVLAVLVPID